MLTYFCKTRINRPLSVYMTGIRSVYSSHFGGGVTDDTAIPTPHAQLSQVLVLDQNKSHILLGKHKCGAYKDRWTGLIGEVKKGHETPVAAAQRFISDLRSVEICEALENRAILNFIEADGHTTEELEFMAITMRDTPVNETDTILPKWFPVSEIPYNAMPADDEVWYPPVLNGRLLRGTFVFNGLKLLKYSLYEVDSL